MKNEVNPLSASLQRTMAKEYRRGNKIFLHMDIQASPDNPDDIGVKYTGMASDMFVAELIRDFLSSRTELRKLVQMMIADNFDERVTNDRFGVAKEIDVITDNVGTAERAEAILDKIRNGELTREEVMGKLGLTDDEGEDVSDSITDFLNK